MNDSGWGANNGVGPEPPTLRPCKERATDFTRRQDVEVVVGVLGLRIHAPNAIPTEGRAALPSPVLDDESSENLPAIDCNDLVSNVATYKNHEQIVHRKLWV